MRAVDLLLVAGISAGALASGQEVPENGESWKLFQGLHSTRRIEVRVPTGLAEREMLRLLRSFPQREQFTMTINP